MTDQFVYVGSTLDPKTRHRLRICQPRCPFDREIAPNPEKYEFIILEAFRSDTDNESRTVCRLRENHWMDVLDTYRTPHGFNFQRANIQHYDREAWLAARQRSQTTPECLARKAASQRAAWDRRGRKPKKVKLTIEQRSVIRKQIVARPEMKAFFRKHCAKISALANFMRWNATRYYGA